MTAARPLALLALLLWPLGGCSDAEKDDDEAAEASDDAGADDGTAADDSDPAGGEDGAADGGGDGGSAGEDGGDSGGDEGDPGPEAGVVALETQDGVTLAADFLPAGDAGPAVVLLHMIPPSWDRSSWPASFLAELGGAGWTVLNVDRRGAGASGGRARDAYEGPSGKWDAAAAVDWLTAQGYGPIGIIGASNGTTTALDHTVWAASASEATGAAWLVFLTGGDYTEAQNGVEQAASVPVLFAYSTAERAWSVDQQRHDSGRWVFHEYASGDHGTKLFATTHAAELTADILSFGAAGFSR